MSLRASAYGWVRRKLPQRLRRRLPDASGNAATRRVREAEAARALEDSISREASRAEQWQAPDPLSPDRR
jgi:hypothetical protein